MKIRYTYYLKKSHGLLYTDRKQSDAMIIDAMTDKMVVGHWVYEPNVVINCMKHEFSKIFTSKQI